MIEKRIIENLVAPQRFNNGYNKLFKEKKID
jgi:hypothetical protein